jgi:phospholipid/cholesterol/gamma-HCH transport system ATP-binding protein
VLKGIDFDVQPGEIFVIMGPSGSGKSVLLKHLIGLEAPDAGEILINGESISRPKSPRNTAWRSCSNPARCSIR